MPIISAVGLFCYDKFEETPNEKVVNMSKLTKPYFSLRISGMSYGSGLFLLVISALFHCFNLLSKLTKNTNHFPKIYIFLFNYTLGKVCGHWLYFKFKINTKTMKVKRNCNFQASFITKLHLQNSLQFCGMFC